jgi:hypothetical protein
VIVGGSSVCLESGTNCPAGTVTYWDQLNGALTPKYASTDDLLLGGVSTASAKFAVLNVNNGTPVASVSSGLNGTAAYLTADGSLQTAKRSTLNIGGSTTGNIQLAPGGSTAMTLLGNGNVGIGNTTPASLLDIKGANAYQIQTRVVDSAGGSGFILNKARGTVGS